MAPFRKMLLFLSAAFLLAGCQRSVEGNPATATLRINISHQLNGQPLQLGTPYTNNLGESFTVGKFKYYVSNLVLLNGNREQPIAETYFLVDEAAAASKTLEATVPAGTYTGLRLMLGVDSTRNVSGAQTGSLDPVHDMFWTWSTGYIMAKLEGSSPISAQPNNRIQYHIGGFSGPYSSLRTLEFRFPGALQVSNNLQVDLTSELLRWFDGVHELPIAANTVSMTPGQLAAQYADNYATMFQLKSVAAP